MTESCYKKTMVSYFDFLNIKLGKIEKIIRKK